VQERGILWRGVVAFSSANGRRQRPKMNCFFSRIFVFFQKEPHRTAENPLSQRRSCRFISNSSLLLLLASQTQVNTDRIFRCPRCQQTYSLPWISLSLGRIEPWSDQADFSWTAQTSVAEFNPGERRPVTHSIRTCLRCGYFFTVEVTTARPQDGPPSQTPAGVANNSQYIAATRQLPALRDRCRRRELILEAWTHSNDRLRVGELSELNDPARKEILRLVIDHTDLDLDRDRLRAAEAARHAGNFQLAIGLLNHQFEPSVKPYADFVRDLALLGDVIVRKVAVYPDIVAFERAKTRGSENAAELTRAHAVWEKQKKIISSKHSGFGGFGCLLLFAGIFGAGMLGQWTPLAILLGIVLLLVFLPLASKADREAKAWEEAQPKPNWPIFSPTFNESPPVLGLKAISISPAQRDQAPEAQIEKALDTEEEDNYKPTERVETLLSEWKDPALSEFAQKVKTSIESNLGMLDLFLIESPKAGVIRQSFVKHQMFAFLTIFTIEFKKRHPALLIGYQNQLTREIQACLPLLSYTSEQLIEGFHVFEASMYELTREKEIKFFFDSEREDPTSAPSVPGYLSYLVCDETQMHDDPRASTVFLGLFNSLIECAEKEHPFNRILDSFISRISVLN
jgi:hypothetical protein